MAVVSGRLQIRGWTDKDGNKRQTAEIVADNVYFGDSKTDNQQSNTTTPAFATPSSDFPMLEDDETLPF
jgi:single-strand DNA-binding protein